MRTEPVAGQCSCSRITHHALRFTHHYLAMASVYDLKPRFQNLLRPLMRRLAAAGLTPNAVTLVALVGSLVVGALVSQAARRPWLLLLLPVWLFARMALNAIGG